MGMERDNERGAIVVEATISFTTFLFAIVIILSIVNMSLAQAKIGCALNSAAKDISQYSYIYSLTGLNAKQKAISDKADNTRKDIDEILSGTNSLLNGLSGLNENKVVKSEDSDVSTKDSIFAFLKNMAAEAGKTFVLDKLAKVLVPSKLKTESINDPDVYLKSLGVKNGVNGLNFKDSVFCLNGTGKIVLVVKYKIHVIELLGHDIDFDMTQCAVTEAW